MIRLRKNEKAQARMIEYAMLFALVMAAAVTMTVYFKRGVQARIYDARNYMISEVRARTAGQFDGNLYMGYEPYYANTSAVIARDVTERTALDEGGSSGIFTKTYDHTVMIAVNSETAPPRDADLTTPPVVASGGGAPVSGEGELPLPATE